MYNLLVVDDEEIAVRGITQGIDWSGLPLAQILTAYDVTEAKQVFAEHKIHLLLSDIDMPDDNGIELLRWVKEHSPQTETIFLTGHADFGYAQQAVHLNSFDYLLKPIDHGQLKATVRVALDKIQKAEEMKAFNATYEFYYRQWNRQLPLLSERFWQDVLNLRIPMTKSHLESAYALYNIPLEPCQQVQAVLISVEEWKEPLSERDEEIMLYAVKNAAEEILLKDMQGQVVQDNGLLFAILYNPDENSTARLAEQSHRFIEQCMLYLRCVISCYVGEPSMVPELGGSAGRLSEIERDHITPGGKVILQRDYRKEASVLACQLNFADWAVLLENGKRAELHLRLADSFKQMESGQADLVFLEGFYHGIVHIVFQTLQKKSIAMEDVFRSEEWRDPGAICRSIPRVKEWAIQLIDRAIAYMQEHSKELSSFVQRAIAYIDAHIADELSREEIAGHVYLNPAYLSRLFKKETGQSLTDYIIEARFAKVKPQLAKTNLKISDIAVSVGYDNFSHFTRMFKKATGLTPYEYRRKYQSIE